MGKLRGQVIRFFTQGHVCSKGQCQDLNRVVCIQSTCPSLDLTACSQEGLEVSSLVCCQSLGSLEKGSSLWSQADWSQEPRPAPSELWELGQSARPL